ncbi:MAG: helicase [Gammaproteobacteria bacterium GWE2_37_16]|nr:MAG: helicase [Gammaproteobacteria bacterium GWE2_37_16]
MNIDFGKLNSAGTVDTVLSPREIFAALPSKEAGKFEYPRDVQTQVWNHWFERRNENDLVIKMNTGSGKTVVGLLILKSCLNEQKGPAVYVAPDNYLVKQVLLEAHNLGIETTEEVDSPRFLSRKAILIINIHKLVNGLSKFGVGDEGVKTKIGSLLIDDAHACLDTIEDQFMITISHESEVYKELYDIFSESLYKQCESKACEIALGEPSTYMQVPFWVWQDKVEEISVILTKHKHTDKIKFVWSLLKESLKLCRCVVSAKKIEISPHCIPIHIMPSITKAYRKIFMTANFADDGILSTHFGITEESISKAVTPDSAGDVGDRMILLPQAINPNISDNDIKQFCKKVSLDSNVVVIVPSDYRAQFWKDQADLVLTKDNIYAGIAQLKSRKVGLVILVNRYDGIDLPKDACRFLIIDSLPDVRRQIDKVNQSILMDGDRLASQRIQRIEQGMGRGIRSNDDYCVVFLMGKSLTSHLYAEGGIEKFSPATRAQLALSEQLSEQFRGKGLEEIGEGMSYCLKRNQDWVTHSKGAVASLIYSKESYFDRGAVAIRNAYDFACHNDYEGAEKELLKLVNVTTDKSLKGYFMQCLAEYINFNNVSEAQKTLKSAVSQNYRVIKPVAGIAYHKLDYSISTEQARACSAYLKNLHGDPNKILIEINGLLERLIFSEPETFNVFEESIKKLALYLGFESQRPESVSNKGPDVLWAIGGLNYLVIECKNGSITDTINKKDCNQLNGSFEWFKNEYDNTCKCTPIMIHRSSVFEHAASPNEQTRIIDVDNLEKLKKNVLSFIKSICFKNVIHDVGKIRESLMQHKLCQADLLQHFTSKYSVK